MFIFKLKKATYSFFLHPYNRKGEDYKHSNNEYLLFLPSREWDLYPQERYKKP